MAGESSSPAELASWLLLEFGETCGSTGRSSLTCRPAVTLAASQPPRGRGHPALKPLPLSGRPVLRSGNIMKSARRWPGPTLKQTWSFGYTSSGSFETQCSPESTGAPALKSSPEQVPGMGRPSSTCHLATGRQARGHQEAEAHRQQPAL